MGGVGEGGGHRPAGSEEPRLTPGAHHRGRAGAGDFSPATGGCWHRPYVNGRSGSPMRPAWQSCMKHLLASRMARSGPSTPDVVRGIGSKYRTAPFRVAQPEDIDCTGGAGRKRDPTVRPRAGKCSDRSSVLHLECRQGLHQRVRGRRGVLESLFRCRQAAPRFPNRIGPPPCGRTCESKSLSALMPAAHELIGQRAT